MSKVLVVKNCGHLVTMDAARRVLKDGWLVSRDGFIEVLGEGAPPDIAGADTVDAPKPS